MAAAIRRMFDDAMGDVATLYHRTKAGRSASEAAGRVVTAPRLSAVVGGMTERAGRVALKRAQRSLPPSSAPVDNGAAARTWTAENMPLAPSGVGYCIKFQKGTCRRAASCPWVHASVPAGATPRHGN